MHRIALIEGDGIGREVVPAGIRVIEAAARHLGFRCEFVHFDWSCERYAATGRMMPEDGLRQLRDFDAIYLGAVGYPGVPDHVSLWGLLLPIRREFDLYANLRPVRLFEGVPCPLVGRKPGEIDFVVVRENTEGEYSDIGGRQYAGTEREFVVQQAVHSRVGVDRILRHAFETARKRARRKVTLATKSNGILHAMPYWDERYTAMASEYPDVEADKYHVDILAAQFVQYPDRFSVVVGSNLFGDILSDLGPAVAGGIGIAASANLDPQRRFPSMFEPVHGSAPDIAGQGIANPVAAIWSASLMLEHLGEMQAAAQIMAAIESSLRSPLTRTRDVGGSATTDLATRAVLECLEARR
ncbi:tartrate dehydrogenase [Nevskia sp.]|uniref:tartrate dehydrogenase n=1 Tax=Nevskia sp. TaxID=1929292 RepID=UPI0025F9E4ED|nr:tartrate dehydrogenase [Nevskia sp.]